MMSTVELGSQISAVETITTTTFPQLVHVILESSDGARGLGETYHRALPIATYVHDIIAPLILGQSSLNSARTLHRIGSRFDGGNAWPGVSTVDSSAVSAIDIAQWDLRAKLLGVPVVELLGGRAHDSIRVYNTCAGYGFRSEPGTASRSTTNRGFGLCDSISGPYEDFEAMWERPAELAMELIAEGYTAMKVFTFNPAASKSSGVYLSAKSLDEAVRPLRAIRDAVGDGIDLMMDINFMWSYAACRRIIKALEPFDLLWIEDPVWWGARRHHDSLQKMTDSPIAAFDYAAGYETYLRMLEDGGVGIMRIDPQWCGGITEAAKIASHGQSIGIPVVFHDCTGPVQFVASTHLALNAPNTLMQESVRAYWRTIYPKIVTQCPVYDSGECTPPSGIGLGTELADEFLSLPDLRHIRTQITNGEPSTVVLKDGA